MSNIYGHNSKSIKATEKIDDNEIKQIVQGVMYNTNQYNTEENMYYHPQQTNPVPQPASFNAPLKQKVRISEDLYLAIRQIVKDEIQQFKKSLKHKDYTNEFSNINRNFKMLEKEIGKLKKMI
jgi:hypothetical protein